MVDLAPLKHSPAFARLWIGGTVSGIGAQMTVVAVGLQIYEITDSTFAVGLVGGFALVPMIVAGLWGGMLADVFDRRRLAVASSLVAWASTFALVLLAVWDAAAHAHGGHAPVWPFYVVTTVNAVAATISSTTRGSVVARILPPHLVSRATALNGIAFGAALTLGPAAAGILASSAGLAWTFAVDAVLFTAGFLGVWSLPALPRLGEQAQAGWGMLREGAAFLGRSPNIRMSFIVDVIAMTFGRPYVLFPALGATVVGGGSLTVGALTAAGAVGTILVSLFSGPVAHVHRHGVAIARAITVFGCFAVVFGVVVLVMGLVDHDAAPGWAGIYWPAMVLLGVAMAGLGAADEVSSIFRQTMIIQASPDEMRGRLQGIFVVVVTGGPRIGDMYAGVLATAVGLWCPPLLGGLVIVVLIAVVTRVRRASTGVSFRDYDDRHPVA
ncbi:MFS transporter [Demequina litorisediminis]|uniref:Multidrug efflux pump Tap n=1 Tax=Demequina litorisediminis TaxID=1849022 RepID=A0ABQ6II23_9MICO|nr:MFS transporter [Demequina litorisediminis]GMA36812.1 MFS transporter [Demequina litorisediminis]